MKIDFNSIELVKEPNILKKMELAGRCCYNSQNLITDGSDKKFIKKIVESGHTSVLEHSNIIVKYYETMDTDDIEFVFEWLLARKALTEARVLITVENVDDTYFIIISGNARAWLDFLNPNIKSEYLLDADDHVANLYQALHVNYPDLFVNSIEEPWTNNNVTILDEATVAKINIQHTSYTFKIVTSRDITHQIVRHRLLSFSQQSQRWVNYTLDKNDGEITFIQPRIKEGTEEFEDWQAECDNIQSLYFKLIESGYKPEVARNILPNCTRTIIYVTGHYKDWMHFIELRSGATAQEEIRDIANKIDKEIKKCYID